MTRGIRSKPKLELRYDELDDKASYIKSPYHRGLVKGGLIEAASSNKAMDRVEYELNRYLRLKK